VNFPVDDIFSVPHSIEPILNDSYTIHDRLDGAMALAYKTTRKEGMRFQLSEYSL
jgi:hypothetical protein